MKRIITAVLLLGAFGASVAAAGPIEDRQALMKQIQAATKASNAIAKAPSFDAAAAKAQMDIISVDATKISGLFPVGSDKGAVKTSAGPAIWSDSTGFKTASAKLSADAAAAGAATDAVSFTAGFKKLQADCGACHMTYRLTEQ